MCSYGQVVSFLFVYIQRSSVHISLRMRLVSWLEYSAELVRPCSRKNLISTADSFAGGQLKKCTIASMVR